MKWQNRFEDHFSLAGWLIIAGLIVEMLTLFWVHPLSFTLFLGLGFSLTGAGIALYLHSVLTWGKKAS